MTDSTRATHALASLALPALALALAGPSARADGELAPLELVDDLGGGMDGVLNDEDHLGFSVDRIDVDGDGVVDLVTGAHGDSDTVANGGAVWIVFLNADGTVRERAKINAVQGGFGGTIGANDQFGSVVAAIGDVNLDGTPDIAARQFDSVWVLRLNPDGSVKGEKQIREGLNGFVGPTATGFGVSIEGVGDFNADGVRDIAVGDTLDDDGAPDAGAVWMLALKIGGAVKAEQKISATAGGFLGALDELDFFGSALARVGDLDGDGVDDLAVGALNDDDGSEDQGAIWVLRLNADGTVKAETKISATSGAPAGLFAGLGSLGSALGRAKDLDGDGIEDLLVSSLTAHLRILMLDGDGSVRSFLPYNAAQLGLGLAPADLFGSSIALAGDYDGDGAEDLFCGAAWWDGAGLDRGGVFVLDREGFASAAALPLGCGLNPAGSLAVTVPPSIGGAAELEVDNPLGTQPAGALPVLALSAAHLAGPCGVLLPGFHMSPGDAGELLLGDPIFHVSTGAPWAGPGSPATFVLPVPQDVTLLGASVFAQGAILDLLPGAAVFLGLTEGAELVIGT